jgi:hypothetical protein
MRGFGVLCLDRWQSCQKKADLIRVGEQGGFDYHSVGMKKRQSPSSGIRIGIRSGCFRKHSRGQGVLQPARPVGLPSTVAENWEPGGLT